jgi:hypothetical protein
VAIKVVIGFVAIEVVIGVVVNWFVGIEVVIIGVWWINFEHFEPFFIKETIYVKYLSYNTI